MGGMFNPVHNGHLRAAVEFSEALTLGDVFMMPCHQPAHKNRPDQSSAQRKVMLDLALLNFNGVRVDDREMRRGHDRPSYTIDSLLEIRAEIGPNTPLYFAMGTDAFNSIESWHQWQQLFDVANIVVLHRPGTNINISNGFLLQRKKTLADRGAVAGHLYDLVIPALDISSTQIRAAIGAKKNIGGLLPEAVENYINQYKLYQ